MQNFIFQDLVTHNSIQCVAFALWSSVLALLRANGKYNVKLHYLTRPYQITSI